MRHRKKRAFFRNRGRVPHQAPRPLSVLQKMMMLEMQRLGLLSVRRYGRRHG